VGTEQGLRGIAGCYGGDRRLLWWLLESPQTDSERKGMAILTEINSENSGERDQGTAPPADNQPTTPTSPTGVSSNVGSNGAAPTEDPKAKYGFWIVIVGLGSVIVLYIGTIITFAILSTADILANNVVAAMGAITGVIGSLVGAYFGVQVGASGKETSDAAAAQSSALAQGAMSQLDPGQTQDAIQAAAQITSLPTGSPR
jgi:hypothetical protein